KLLKSGGDSSVARESGEQGQWPEGWDPEAQANKLKAAVKGWGTDERAVFDVLWTGRPDMTRAIEEKYNALYDPDLEDQLHDELSGDDLRRALEILGHGELGLRDKVREAAAGWGTDEARLFDSLQRASAQELATLKEDLNLVVHLEEELSGADLALLKAYLSGQGVVAARLKQACAGLGTDEAAVFRAIQESNETDRKAILASKDLMGVLWWDLDASDYLKAEKLLSGKLDNVDRIEIAVEGWGTDEAGLVDALSGLTAADFQRIVAGTERIQGVDGLIELLQGDTSGADEAECLEILHQKRLRFDEAYQTSFMQQSAQQMGADFAQDKGATVLVAGEGEATSALGRLKIACSGLVDTDESAIWAALTQLTAAERRFLQERNPEGILDTLKNALDDEEYARATAMLRDDAEGAKASLLEAVEVWGTDERLISDGLDRALRDGHHAAIAADAALMTKLKEDISAAQYAVLTQVLASGTYTPFQRLQWATAFAGTDEEKVFELCRAHKDLWFVDGAIDEDVDWILLSELSTRDYWKATDLLRPEARTEPEKLDRSKEELERERGGGLSNDISAGIMDSLSMSGTDADDAWREYNASYNQAVADGEVSKDEQQTLDQDRAFSERKLQDYREVRGSVANWASMIAVTLIGVVATLATAGTAGPFFAAIAAKLGGTVATACTAMVAAAVAKVGLTKAIEGEGYDLDGYQAVVDAVAGAVDVGLMMLGGKLASQMTERMLGTSAAAASKGVAQTTQGVFGRAGSFLLSAGLEGGIDGTIGGVGAGLVQGLADEETYAGTLLEGFGRVSSTVALNGAMGGLTGAGAAPVFKSVVEVFGGAFKGRPATPETPEARIDLYGTTEVDLDLRTLKETPEVPKQAPEPVTIVDKTPELNAPKEGEVFDPTTMTDVELRAAKLGKKANRQAVLDEIERRQKVRGQTDTELAATAKAEGGDSALAQQ
ncbi:MAG: hypothetical protein H6740_29265, partial [Alphaproteobacteria bacterium]|nr:hypothetical protein [Alphaproteobacteria bacterium]